MAELSFAPGEADLVGIPRGDSISFQVTITEDDGTTAKDVSGYTWLAQVRETVDATDVLMTFDVDDTDAATGVLVLSLAAADWPAEATPLPTDAWRWDLEGTNGSNVRTYLAGKFKVFTKGDVSRA
jgi:hypothetical protein